ncbi:MULTISPECIES: sarcosine oxidase subunit beta family protein [Thalassospira]|uniref:Sarcosine oxidase subunit beta n=1 Tax=Thalassospira profundimaris TaxID=502049 RepID=A0A367V2F3_9PROT|nr:MULTISPECIES: sarcosine oxidase subunit beta family protein [Thalassospira]MBR9900581.1 sarcosine oxidase subunit beta family protein [Rhodospirillales bacterium]KZB69639.1 sarcosine oxidase subunit beta [Thalassospira sp. MCCC 1A01148]MBO6809167.1 sarcosine oxidase subunit beta family protein [Thalassospira sp.]MBO6841126.1 sarcosine oxidase subunit beta family protein [Thalassospira sp.]RCK19366.1 sarcosine oxidase subunit beta [Thalassospira profundimaris]
MRYSALSLLGNAFSKNKNWKPAWRNPDPKPHYDVIIIGGGGHGLATAYYLSKVFGVRNVAVLEKGYLGSGNIGRNTTIIRSNYLLEGNNPFYEFSMKLWEGLEQDFNFNAMVSQRGVINLFHSDAQRDAYTRRGNAMRLHGVDAELLDRDQLREKLPFLDYENARFPIMGGLMQARGGTVRHDAVAWGFARGADQNGVDIIQNCEVTGIDRDGNQITGVQTTRGAITCNKLAMAVAGSSSHVAKMVDMRLPIESHALQAFVSEGLKPFIDTVVTFGAGHFYVSQSDKGGLVFGGDIEGYNSYAQRGNLACVEHVAEAGMAMIPALSRVRILRSWGGIMDMSMDGSPIMDRTHLGNLYFNGGWCYGGFKATPASGYCFAHLLATDTPHETATAFRMDRFARGYLLDEKGVGAQANLH